MNSPLSSIALYLLYTVNKIDFKKWLIHNLVLFIFIFIGLRTEKLKGKVEMNQGNKMSLKFAYF